MKRVKDIKAGDTFVFDGDKPVWTAVEDARVDPETDGILVRVQYTADGGIGTRVWDDHNHELEIKEDVYEEVLAEEAQVRQDLLARLDR